MLGEIYSNTPLSAYQPSLEVQELTKYDKTDFYIGDEILSKPWSELNQYGVIERMNKDQRTFNAFVDESIEDSNDAWKWKGTRSMARNKVIHMHAQLTSSYILPEVSAQNEEDEEDMDMAGVMHDIVEWMTSPGNSNYQPAFLMATMGMLVNPVTYLSAEYAEIIQTIRERQENGSITKKEVRDEILSGFQAQVMSADQILITNAFEQNIQKQRKIIKRRYIDFEEAKAQWQDHPNWQFVTRGIKSIYNEDDGLFYDVKDDNQTINLVEECTTYSRREDRQICYINGIYMGADNVEENPIMHRDNRDTPKYNLVGFGYQRINEHFFYYKSLVNSLGWDNQLIDAMYETTMNKEILNLLPPIIVTGEENVDTDIIFPGSQTAFASPDVQVKPALPPNNNAAGYQAMQTIEASMSDSSISPISEGQLPGGKQSAYAIAAITQASKTLLSAVGMTLGQSVAQYGMLMIDIAVNHLTVADVEEISGGDAKLKYKSFILNDKVVQGKRANKRIKFDDSLVGSKMSSQDKEDYGVALAEKVGFPDQKEHLYVVNPELFSRMKYLVRVDPDVMLKKNAEYEQGMMNSLYTLLREDPLIEPEVLVRKLAYAYFRGDGEELMAKNKGIVGQIMNNQPNAPADPNAPVKPAGQGTPSSPAGNIASTKMVGNAMGGGVPK